MKKIDYHIAVCVPSAGSWKSVFGRSLALLFAKFNEKPLRDAKSQRLSLLASEGSMLVQVRHTLVKNALRAGCTHILFLDSDMQFPPELIHSLVDKRKDIVGANCTTRVFPVTPTARKNEKPVRSREGMTGALEVDHVGLAATLIKADVFKRLQPPFFRMEWLEDHGAYCGEDVYFCLYAREMGYKVFVDQNISHAVKHCGNLVFSHDMVKEEMFDV